MSVTLGSFLRNKRREKELSAKDVGKVAGITASTVRQIERGEIKKPPIKRLKGFADILNVSFEKLKRLAGHE